MKPVLAPALAIALLLTGCGQKGPLYLPDDEAAAERYGSRTPAQEEPTDNDADKDID